MSKLARTILSAALAMSAANLTAAPLPGFVLTAQTEHFAFYSRDQRKVDAERSESYLRKLETMLGAEVTGTAEYYRYGSAQELAAGTGSYASGVTFAKSGQIHSTLDFHAHEIVHLVAGQLGNPGTFFQEGLAVALGNEGRWRGTSVDKLAKGRARAINARTLITSFERLDPEVGYPLAGSFVQYLIKVHGIAKVSEFFRASGPSGADRDAAFANAFGGGLDSVGAAWLASL